MATKKEADGEHPSSHYLVVEDPGEPSKWHLRVKDASGKPDHRLMGAAWAALHGGYRGNKYEGPNKQEAISKLKSLYKSEGMETPDSESASEVKNGLIKLAIAYTGKFTKGDHDFVITADDLDQMQKNLMSREAPIDYEHLSATAGPPGWSKAAGWIRKPAGIATLADGSKILYAWTELTPAALAMVKQKEYRYFSPEIRWSDADEHGNQIGTRLAAGALTNRPFLKELPPIEISDADYQQLFGLAAREDGKLAMVALSEGESLISVDAVHVDQPVRDISVAYDQNGGEQMAKRLKIKKLADGEHAGHHGLFDEDGNMAGYMTDGDVQDYAKSLKPDTTKENEKLTEQRNCESAALTELMDKEGRVNLAEAAKLQMSARSARDSHFACATRKTRCARR